MRKKQLENFHELEWDSRFFGYKIADIYPERMELSELKALILELRKNGIKLAYCYVSPNDEISNNSLNKSAAFLADSKVTFINSSYNVLPLIKKYSEIRKYNLPYVSENLKLLALQSGIYSRFNIDQNFRDNEFEKLYDEWISKSVNKEVADEILVYLDGGIEKGFITLLIRNNIGSIGLIAVDEKERGKQIGKKLIHEAFCFFNEAGVDSIEVVSQMANKAACNFYESLGFEIKKIVNVYHLWIK